MKAYLVIEEFDPYVSYPDIDSRAEISIVGVYLSKEKALDIRNELAREEAKECNVEIDEEDYLNFNKTISVLGTEYYILEYDV